MPTARSAPATSIAELQAFLGTTREAVRAVLARWGAAAVRELDPPVGAAIAYSLDAPGKYLRPALVIGAFRELGGAGDPAELAAAVELVHTYSLVHDDLPCMDDDDLRRGRRTTHREFDVAAATEAGFRMVELSARVLAAGAATLDLPTDTVGAIGRELYRAAGVDGMIGGQVRDLEAEARATTAEALVRIHRAKTGALIAACGVIGALAAGADARAVEAVRRYGTDVGLAFQIVDDVLDATATSRQLGKTAGKDAQQRKASFAALLGVHAARAEAERHVAAAIDHLRVLRLDSSLLAALARFTVDRGS